MIPALAVAAPAGLVPGELVRLLFLLAIMLVVGKLSGELFDRLGQPAVLGELLAGAVLGGSALGIIPSRPDDVLYPVIHVLAEIGVIILLFEIGLETDLKQLLRVGPAAASVAVVGVILPFVAGWLFWVSPLSVPGFNRSSVSVTAFFLGAALTATSVGITARVLRDLRIMGTREARLILGAAVLDDILGLVLLGLVATLLAGGSISLAGAGRALVVALGFLAVAVGLGLRLAPHVFATIDRMRGRGVLLVSAFAFVLLVSALAQVAGSALIIGAFAAGIILSGTRQFDAIETQMKPVADIFTPFFFLSVGAQLDLGLFNVLSPGACPVLAVGGVVTLIAALGKVAAGWAAPWLGFNRAAVGFGMMPRGEVGLIFANVGLSEGVLSRELFGAIMIMVVVTTFLAPPLLKWAVRRAGVGPQDQAGTPPWHSAGQASP